MSPSPGVDSKKDVLGSADRQGDMERIASSDSGLQGVVGAEVPLRGPQVRTGWGVAVGIGTVAWRGRHRGGWPGLRFRDQFCVGGAEAPESPEAGDPHAPPHPRLGWQVGLVCRQAPSKTLGSTAQQAGEDRVRCRRLASPASRLGVPHPAPVSVSVSVPGQQGVGGLLVKDLPAWGGPEIALLSPHLPAEEGRSLEDSPSHVLPVDVPSVLHVLFPPAAWSPAGRA